MGTDATADRGKRHGIANCSQRVIEAVFLDSLDVRGDIDVSRALVLTGRGVFLDVIHSRCRLTTPVEVGKKVITEMGHRIKHRYGRALTESALTVLQQLVKVGNRLEVSLLTTPLDN